MSVTAVSCALLLASATTPPERTRVVKTSTVVMRHDEPGEIVIDGAVRGDMLAVDVARERRCRSDLVKTTIVERYRKNEWAVPAAVILGGVGVVGLGAGALVALAAPNQPPIDDEFSRGELSREGAFGIAATSATLGVVAGAAAVVAVVGGSEAVLGRTPTEEVVRSNEVDCGALPLDGAAVVLIYPGGASQVATADKAGRVRTRLPERLPIPDGGEPVVTVSAQLDGDASVAQGIVELPASAFLGSLRDRGSTVEDFARFERRFPDAQIPDDLGSRRQELFAARERADEEARAAESARAAQVAADLERAAQAAAEAARLTPKPPPLDLSGVFVSTKGECLVGCEGRAIAWVDDIFSTGVDDEPTKATLANIRAALETLATRDSVASTEGLRDELIAECAVHGTSKPKLKLRWFEAMGADGVERDVLGIPLLAFAHTNTRETHPDGPTVFGVPVRATFSDLACSPSPIITDCTFEDDYTGDAVYPVFPRTMTTAFSSHGGELHTIHCRGPKGKVHFPLDGGPPLVMFLSPDQHGVEGGALLGEVRRAYGYGKTIGTAVDGMGLLPLTVWSIATKGPGAIKFTTRRGKAGQLVGDLEYRDEQRILRLKREQDAAQRAAERAAARAVVP